MNIKIKYKLPEDGLIKVMIILSNLKLFLSKDHSIPLEQMSISSSVWDEKEVSKPTDESHIYGYLFTYETMLDTKYIGEYIKIDTDTNFQFTFKIVSIKGREVKILETKESKNRRLKLV